MKRMINQNSIPFMHIISPLQSINNELNINLSNINQHIKIRQQLLRNKKDILTRNHLQASQHIKNCPPSKIIIQPSIDFQFMRKILHQHNPNHEIQVESLFAQNNKKLENQLSLKMSELQDIDLQISKYNQSDDQIFKNIDRIQENIKEILLKNGSINQAQSNERKLNQYKEQIKHNSKTTKILKRRKYQTAQTIISLLNNLDKCRKDYLKKIDENTIGSLSCSLDIQQCIGMLNKFIENISEIQNKIRLQNNQYLKTPLKNSQKTFESLLNKDSVTKGFSHFQKNSIIVEDQIEQFIRKYDQILGQMRDCQYNENKWFKDFQDIYKKELRDLALQKYYIHGLIGNNYQINNVNSSNIQQSVSKCVSYRQKFNQKVKDKAKISEKIANIEETNAIFQKIISELDRHQHLVFQCLGQLQNIYNQWIIQNNQQNYKILLHQREALKMNRYLLQNEIQICAKQANLQGYKIKKQQLDVIGLKIATIQFDISKEMSNQSSHLINIHKKRDIERILKKYWQILPQITITEQIQINQLLKRLITRLSVK